MELARMVLAPRKGLWKNRSCGHRGSNTSKCELPLDSNALFGTRLKETKAQACDDAARNPGASMHKASLTQTELCCGAPC